jgi:hypothetical protein
MTFQGRCKNSQGRCKTISGEVRTSPHLPSKSVHGIKILNVRYIIIYKQILELETKTKIAQSFTHRILKGLNTSQNSIPVSNYRSAIILMPYNPQQFSLTREDLED